MASVPVQITWTTGVVVTAAQLNSNVRDSINFLLAVPRCILTRSVVSPVNSSGVPVACTFDTEIVDNDSMHSNVTNPTRMTANTAGLFGLEFYVHWDYNNATPGTVYAGINLNGNTVWTGGGGALVADTRTGSNSSTLGTSSECQIETDLNVGDYVEFFVGQATGSTINVLSGQFGMQAIGYWIAGS